MSKKLTFYAYGGGSLIDYLLDSRQATRIEYSDGDLVITFSDEFDHLTKKRELIKSRLKKVSTTTTA